MNPTARPFVSKFVPPPPPGPSPLQRAEDEISALKKQVATLQAEKTLFDQRYSELADFLRTVTAERDQAIADKAAFQLIIERMQTERDQASADNATLRIQLDKTTASTTQLQRNLEEALTKLHRKDGHQARADSAICELRQTQAKLEATIADRDQAIAHKTALQADMEEWQRANTMLRDISTRQHAQIEELRRQLETRPVTNPISPPARSMSEWLLCSIDILETSTLGAVHVIHTCHTEPDFKKELPRILYRMDHIVNRLLPLHTGLKELMARESVPSLSIGELFKQQLEQSRTGVLCIMPR